MDSLSTYVEKLSRSEAIEHIFGASSERVEAAATKVVAHPGVVLSEEPLYQILALVLLVLYFVWISGYIAKRGFKVYVAAGSAIKESREVGVHTGRSRRRIGDILLMWSLIVGVYVLFITKSFEVLDGVVFSLLPDVMWGQPLTQYVSSVGFDVWMLVILLGFFSSMLWSVMLLYISDRLSHSGNIFRPIMELRSNMLLLSMIYLMPFILLSAFGASDLGRFYVTLSMVVIFTIIYLIRSFLLFRSKKISILLWILYLCGVEIFPLTLVWGIFTRS